MSFGRRPSLSRLTKKVNRCPPRRSPDFLTVPCYLICMAVKNGQPLLRRDSLAMVAIGSAGFAANYFSAKAFVNSSALVSFIGSFVVGVLGNLWARMTRESAFVSWWSYSRRSRNSC